MDHAMLHLVANDVSQIGSAVAYRELLAAPRASLPQDMFYQDAQSALFWLEAVRGESIDVTMRDIPVYACARSTAARVQGERGVDIIALGCGDGTLEIEFCKEFAFAFPGEVGLYLFDINTPLLIEAHRAAYEKLNASGQQYARVRIAAIQGDFYHLNRYLFIRGISQRRKIILFFGGTFGNLHDEIAFCRDALSVFSPGDLLITHVSVPPCMSDDEDEIRRRDPRLNGTLNRGMLAHDEAWFRHVLHSYGIDRHVDIDFRYELSRVGCPVPASYAIEIIASLSDGREYSVFRIKRYQLQQLCQTMRRTTWIGLDGLPQGSPPTGYLYMFRKADRGL